MALDQHLAYCASKAAIISLTKVLAYEWGRYNISVKTDFVAAPTELGKKAWAGEVGEAFKAKIPSVALPIRRRSPRRLSFWRAARRT